MGSSWMMETGVDLNIWEECCDGHFPQMLSMSPLSLPRKVLLFSSKPQSGMLQFLKVLFALLTQVS